MLAYVDTSVLLRFVLGEESALPEFRKIDHAVSSELIRVEALRTLDRLRLKIGLSETEYANRASLIHDLLSSFELIHLGPQILSRTSQPFPTSLGTLDAIHMSSCLLYSERSAEKVTLCTHDESLKLAGRALGFEVLG